MCPLTHVLLDLQHYLQLQACQMRREIIFFDLVNLTRAALHPRLGDCRY